MSGNLLPPTHVPLDPYVGPVRRDTGMLKLDGNEGPKPPSRLVETLVRQDTDALRDYPSARNLEVQIAQSLALDAEQVVVTTGADDALDRVCRAFLQPGRRMVLPVPTFEMLYRFAAVAGGELTTVPWTDHFPTEQIIAALGPDVSLVTVVSPNNPTGLVVTGEELEHLARAARGAIVLLDHVYVEYADHDLTSLASRLGNVVTVRSFSKAWGLAGCRVGYAVADPEIATILRNAGNPFPVAGLSLAAARAQLEAGTEDLQRHVAQVRAGRARLCRELERLGVKPTSSQANFVFADLGSRVELVQGGLAALGVRVRRFAQRPEIASGLRISVPGREHDESRLGQGLRTVLHPEALLFDMDGVLVDVTRSYRQCVLDTASSFGIEIHHDELEEAVLSGNAGNDWLLTRRLLAARGIEVSLDEVTARFQRLYLGSADSSGLRDAEVPLIDADLLRRLSQRLKLGVVTGRPRDEAEWFLRRHGLRDAFGVVVTMEDAPGKPDPSPVRLALERLGLRRAWMIGDTPDDMRAAAGAGVVPLGIVAPGDDVTLTSAALRAAGAALLLSSLSNLEELLP